MPKSASSSLLAVVLGLENKQCGSLLTWKIFVCFPSVLARHLTAHSPSNSLLGSNLPALGTPDGLPLLKEW